MTDAIVKRGLDHGPGDGLKGPVPGGAVHVDLEVPFHDVDPLVVAWHGHYFKYFELARTALQRHHRLDAPDLRELGFAWFVIETRTRHVQALRYGERFRVYAWFVEDDPRITIAYEIRSLATLDGALTGHRVARARTTFCSTTPRGELLFETPSVVKARIGLRG